MEFSANRGGRQSQPAPQGAPGPARPTNPGTAGTGHESTGQKPEGGKNKGGLFNMKNASIALLFSATILVVALLVFLISGSPKDEANYVNADDYQAVFLNGGQVYFGKVTDLNKGYLRMVDIYYLRVNQQVQPTEDAQAQLPTDSDISLVKLGCELHGPRDEMLINREQIVFWENLKEDGQVSEAIATYKQENPDGQDCDTPEQAGVPEQQVPSVPQAETENGFEDEDTTLTP